MVFFSVSFFLIPFVGTISGLGVLFFTHYRTNFALGNFHFDIFVLFWDRSDGNEAFEINDWKDDREREIGSMGGLRSTSIDTYKSCNCC